MTFLFAPTLEPEGGGWRKELKDEKAMSDDSGDNGCPSWLGIFTPWKISARIGQRNWAGVLYLPSVEPSLSRSSRD